LLFTPSHCWAAGEAVLPSDYTLDVIQNFLTGPLAHFVIVTSSIVALLAFALAGDTELARRFREDSGRYWSRPLGGPVAELSRSLNRLHPQSALRI